MLLNQQDHVIALNNKIVESGGKPLLGKDHCKIRRLEQQVEEFLNAVLHRKGIYTFKRFIVYKISSLSTLRGTLAHLLIYAISHVAYPNWSFFPVFSSGESGPAIISDFCSWLIGVEPSVVHPAQGLMCCAI